MLMRGVFSLNKNVPPSFVKLYRDMFFHSLRPGTKTGNHLPGGLRDEGQERCYGT